MPFDFKILLLDLIVLLFDDFLLFGLLLLRFLQFLFQLFDVLAIVFNSGLLLDDLIFELLVFENE